MNKNSTNFIKGILSIIILFCHMNFNNIFKDMGYLAVGMYFFLSGYNLSNNNKNLKNFLSKKIIRIYFPFVIANILFIMLHEKNFSLLLILGIQHTNKILWYVYSIMLLYLLYYIFVRLNFSNKIIPIYIILTYFLIITIIPTKLVFDANGIFPITFLIGWYFKLQESKILEIKNINKYSLTLFIVIFLISFKILNIYLCYNHFVYFIFELLSSSLFCVLFFYINIQFNLKNKILEHLGKHSYEIYLFHNFYIILIWNFNIPLLIKILLIILLTLFTSCIINNIATYFKNNIINIIERKKYGI